MYNAFRFILDFGKSRIHALNLDVLKQIEEEIYF